MPISPPRYSDEELNGFFTEACNAQTAGRFAEAEEKYLLLLGYFPDAAMLRYNLGLVYYSLENFTGALHEFSQALTSQPEDSDTLFNLALSQKKTGDSRAAVATYRQLLEARPDNTDAWYNLAGCYRDTHADEQAISCYQRALALDSDYLPALNNLAYLYHRSGDMQQAEICYRQVLTLRSDDDSAHYMLASLLGTPLEHAPDSYVRHFFDAYAEDFEQSLVDGLGYDTPRQLQACFKRCTQLKGVKDQYDHGLDLGCGTGLSGIAFKGIVPVLDGVDLSANMLLQAAGKDCYHGLYQDSIIHYLQTTAATYDFFLATDVFIYVGELGAIFSALRAVARPGALFCFSTETLDATDSTGYQLQKTGRFAYSRDYIHSIAGAADWLVLTEKKTSLRKERERWVAGDLWILQMNTRQQ
ncbi:tetratricopeptide repeat protein [Desulfopila sp. IMCC35006]|uniref:tetratricopeptide repeat protein n=1 Tax=Desulfopila sp. IMCC35006 TaxID=2569542 RepID=UPI0010AD0B6F|nr:tetratricopeptide repeat protein [Desulfopila sp. IMCC35006]TKB24391.1 tetratricopeptide repeat protein [Desulfopila sp. IMCC35006]